MKNRLIRYKIYMQRSVGYLAILNSMMIFYMFAKSIGLPNYLMFIVVILGFCSMLVLGFFDSRYVLERETEILYDKAPQIKKLLKR